MKSVRESVLFTMAAIISACVVLASGYLYYVQAGSPWPYRLTIIVVVCAWTVRFARGDRVDASGGGQRRELTWAIVLSGSLFVVALAGVWIGRVGWASEFAGEISERSRGVVIGVVVVVLANVIPKQAGSGRRLAMLRIAGWALVMGGLGYAMAWLLLPLSIANVAALLVLLLSLTYAVARIALYKRKHPFISSPPSG